MARPLQLEYSGALYRVPEGETTQHDIYLTDENREPCSSQFQGDVGSENASNSLQRLIRYYVTTK